MRNREDLGRILKEAFYIARTGRPGPVLIDLPKDVMGELGSAEYPETVNIRGYKPNTSVHIGQLKRAIKMLGRAKKPLFLAGGGVIISRANEVFTKLVEKTNNSGRNNSNGTRGNSDKPPTLHRKSWNAWSICLQYGCQ